MEKLFSEHLYLAYNKNKGLDVRITIFYNIFGPYGTWNNKKEKASAAICRKVLTTNDFIEIFGSGNQTRSFLYIDKCMEDVLRLMESDFIGPVNIGSDEMVTINQLVDLVSTIENKNLKKIHITGPLGVTGRNSDNNLIYKKLGWKPNMKLIDGLKKSYEWIKQEIYYLYLDK